MFKISKPEYVNKTFRMPKELVSELEKLAQEQEISLNQLVIQCCQYALEHLDKD
ncbi:MAG: toxin-antitoxin system HicB family antitoxin [Eubacterium sp.]|nr:toxin-antitoxin system HicB family antitoxin [Eubacterium sp.]